MARPNLSRHRKFGHLARVLGSKAIARGSLELLWDVAYESGDELLGTADDVEYQADWKGDPGVLAGALVASGFLEKDGEFLRVHDLWDHAPEYVRKRQQREIQRKEKGYGLDRNGLPRAVVEELFRTRPHACELCGSTDRLEIDHIIPKAAGGSDDKENLRFLCLTCNRRKSAEDKRAAASQQCPAVSSSEPAVGRPRTPTPTPALKEPKVKNTAESAAPSPRAVDSTKRKSQAEHDVHAEKIVAYYEEIIRPHRPSRYRAREHVVTILKGGVRPEVLWECINLYQPEAVRSELQYRKVAGNFFGRDAVFKSYLEMAQKEVERIDAEKIRRGRGAAGGAQGAPAETDLDGVGV